MPYESQKMKSDRQFVFIKIPRDLYVRIEAYQKTTGLLPDEFVFDAITEKISSISKERRKKQRL